MRIQNKINKGLKDQMKKSNLNHESANFAELKDLVQGNMSHKATHDARMNARGVNRSEQVAKAEFEANRKVGKYGNYSKETRGLA
jgi:hypothetical protein